MIGLNHRPIFIKVKILRTSGNKANSNLQISGLKKIIMPRKEFIIKF